MKAKRNKTIDFQVEEAQAQLYLSRCFSPTEKTTLEQIQDKTLLGDLFSLALYLPTAFVDLLIVDPPYNLNKSFHGKTFKRVSHENYADYTEAWIKAVLPLLKPHASVYVCCDWHSSISIAPILQKYFHIQNRITWQREKGKGASRNWKNAMEDIWFVTLSKKEHTFNLEEVKVRRRVLAPYKAEGQAKDWEMTDEGKFRNTYPSNFWDDLSVPYWSMAENTAHPTQKPEKLLAKLILASSNEGDMVFDPFLGSGTTSVTAKKLGRHYVGIEMNPQYCAWAEKRLEMASQDKSIQGYEDGVFWERNARVLKATKEAKAKAKAESTSQDNAPRS